MRTALFDLYASFNTKLLQKVSALNYNLVSIVTQTAYAIFLILDEDRVHHIRTTIEQQSEIDELEIFSMIDQVKNEAIDIGEWNEEHEAKLNWCGNLLYSNHDWDVDEIRRYISEVVNHGSSIMEGD